MVDSRQRSTPDRSLAGRTALVVGGREGAPSLLCASIARALEAAGAHVFEARLAAAAEPTWRAEGLEAPVGHEGLFEHAVSRMGHVDILVVLGAASAHDGARAQPSEAGAHEGASAHAASVLCAAFIRHLVPGRPGRVVLVSPVPIGPPDAGFADVTDGAAARVGVPIGALDALAASLAPALASIGVTVNAVDPADRPRGWLDDYLRRRLEPALPAGVLDGPDAVARVVALLASDAGAGISGQVVRGAAVEPR